MLDLTGIPVVDNHCHLVLPNQQMEALRFLRYYQDYWSVVFVVVFM